MTDKGRTQHTKGPWLGFMDEGTVVAILPAMRLGNVCSFNQPPSDADAAIMIAAPDLLQALQAVDAQTYCECPYRHGGERNHQPGCFVPMVRAAIAKATQS